MPARCINCSTISVKTWCGNSAVAPLATRAQSRLVGCVRCPKVLGDRSIRMLAFDSSHGWESLRLSFIVNRPKDEPGFRLERHEGAGRNHRYTPKSYSVDRPEGGR